MRRPRTEFLIALGVVAAVAVAADPPSPPVRPGALRDSLHRAAAPSLPPISAPTALARGLTTGQVLDLMGRPSRRHVTESAAGTDAQWVYEGQDGRTTYVYFHDGLVDRIQRDASTR